jgi:hypothetical protein
MSLPRQGAVLGDAVVVEVTATNDEGPAPCYRQEHDGASSERADAHHHLTDKGSIGPD